MAELHGPTAMVSQLFQIVFIYQNGYLLISRIKIISMFNVCNSVLLSSKEVDEIYDKNDIFVSGYYFLASIKSIFHFPVSDN